MKKTKYEKQVRAKKSYKTSQRYYHLMLLPGMIFLVLFHYIPIGGIVMAFQNFVPSKGLFRSDWVGLKNFERLLIKKDIQELLRNTLVISIGKILVVMVVAVLFAILLNEIRHMRLKKGVQTIVYLPHFLSWAVLAPIVYNLLGMDGMVNDVLNALGLESVNFLGSNKTFQGTVIGTYVWKEFGYASIVYLAAITGVDPGLHEAAAIDGASWWRRVWHVTLPAMLPIIVLMLAINVGNILSAGFDQVYNLYNIRVYETGDILDTYVFRVGLEGRQYSLGTAVDLVKSVVGLVLMLSVNGLSKKILHRSVF
ncbi:MAG: sugar ABC transporter permease [Lachnospiraceae bacterium]|nr:sugar ABC transporter permease [Lachnospiraceae bacterium]